MIIKFLTIYWPSSVKPNGKLLKQTSGNNIKGKNVPGIWMNKRNMETLINGFMHIVKPITTSHHPKMGINVLGLSNQ